MRLVRHGPRGAEKPGLLDAQGTLRHLSSVIDDIDGAALAQASLDRLRRIDPTTLPAVAPNTRLGACVGGAATSSASA